MAAEPARKPGRPSKYKPDYTEQARKLCALGAIDKDLAEFFKVSEQTINAWKEKQPEFLEALKVGKADLDAQVEHKLFHRAMGYEHAEVHVTNYQGVVTLTPLVKHYPPDTTAAIFWLKNRQPGKWRETKAIELTGANGGPVRTLNAQMSPEEAARAYKELMGVLPGAG